MGLHLYNIQQRPTISNRALPTTRRPDDATRPLAPQDFQTKSVRAEYLTSSILLQRRLSLISEVPGSEWEVKGGVRTSLEVGRKSLGSRRTSLEVGGKSLEVVGRRWKWVGSHGKS